MSVERLDRRLAYLQAVSGLAGESLARFAQGRKTI